MIWYFNTLLTHFEHVFFFFFFGRGGGGSLYADLSSTLSNFSSFSDKNPHLTFFQVAPYLPSHSMTINWIKKISVYTDVCSSESVLP